jgi:hypothetical protein
MSHARGLTNEGYALSGGSPSTVDGNFITMIIGAMSFFGFLNHWWNLPFLVMLGLVAVFFVVQVFGLFGHHGDHDHGHDHDPDHDHEHHHDGHEGTLSTVLSFFGVGRVPIMVVWVTLFLFTGFVGLFVNRVFFLEGGYPGWAFPVALGGGLAVGLVAVKVFASLAAKLVDTGGKGSTAKGELAGRVGVVASGTLDGRFGEVRVTDGRGHEMLVHARLGDGEPALARGAKVVLVDYDPAKDLFWATVSPAESAEA